MKKKQVLILIIPVIILLAATLTQAATCKERGDITCNQTIDSSDGRGTFELCDECFWCGNETDGICPEQFSDGTTETREIMIQKITWNQDLSSYWTRKLFDNGTTACKALFEGTCKEIKESHQGSGWSTPGGLDCDSTGLIDNTDYKAICNNIPVVSRCHNCPDPQCNATISGTVWDYKTDHPITNVEIEAIFPTQPHLHYQTTTDGAGNYDLEVPTGNYKMSARVFGYDVLIKDVGVQQGNDSVDFQLANGTCHGDCSGFHYPEFPPRCKAECQGFDNGSDMCNYSTIYPQYDVAEACNEKVVGSKIVLEAHPDGNSTVVICCEGNPFNEPRPSINITTTSEIKDLITTTIVKEMNEQPIKVKIVVWNE